MPKGDRISKANEIGGTEFCAVFYYEMLDVVNRLIEQLSLSGCPTVVEPIEAELIFVDDSFR
jgi:hypothetical protein